MFAHTAPPRLRYTTHTRLPALHGCHVALVVVYLLRSYTRLHVCVCGWVTVTVYVCGLVCCVPRLFCYHMRLLPILHVYTLRGYVAAHTLLLRLFTHAHTRCSCTTRHARLRSRLPHARVLRGYLPAFTPYFHVCPHTTARRTCLDTPALPTLRFPFVTLRFAHALRFCRYGYAVYGYALLPVLVLVRFARLRGCLPFFFACAAPLPAAFGFGYAVRFFGSGSGYRYADVFAFGSRFAHAHLDLVTRCGYAYGSHRALHTVLYYATLPVYTPAFAAHVGRLRCAHAARSGCTGLDYRSAFHLHLYATLPVGLRGCAHTFTTRTVYTTLTFRSAFCRITHTVTHGLFLRLRLPRLRGLRILRLHTRGSPRLQFLVTVTFTRHYTRTVYHTTVAYVLLYVPAVVAVTAHVYTRTHYIYHGLPGSYRAGFRILCVATLPVAVYRVAVTPRLHAHAHTLVAFAYAHHTRFPAFATQFTPTAVYVHARCVTVVGYTTFMYLVCVRLPVWLLLVAYGSHRTRLYTAVTRLLLPVTVYLPHRCLRAYLPRTCVRTPHVYAVTCTVAPHRWIHVARYTAVTHVHGCCRFTVYRIPTAVLRITPFGSRWFAGCAPAVCTHYTRTHGLPHCWTRTRSSAFRLVALFATTATRFWFTVHIFLRCLPFLHATRIGLFIYTHSHTTVWLRLDLRSLHSC